MVQIGSDGGLLPAPVVRSAIPMEPAERVDVIVDFRQFGVGSKVILHNTVGEPSTQRGDALRRRHAAAPRRRGSRRSCAELEELPEVNAERSWPLTFQGLAGGGSVWQIAGGGFSEMRIDCRPRQGSTELWTWVNQSERTHPMHLHGYHFRVVSVDGAPPHPGDRGLEGHRRRLSATRPSSCGPYFDYFAGRLRLPLPRRRARRHVDDGPDGGGRVIRRLLAGAALAVALLGPAASAHAATRPIQAFDTPTFRTIWWPNTLAGAGRRHRSSGGSTQPGNANASTHDVWLVGPGRPERAVPRRRATRPRSPAPSSTQAGTYQFYCSIHGGLDARRDERHGRRHRDRPGPAGRSGHAVDRPRLGGPGLPGRRSAPLPNETEAPTVFEEGDNDAPLLELLKVTPDEGARASRSA